MVFWCFLVLQSHLVSLGRFYSIATTLDYQMFITRYNVFIYLITCRSVHCSLSTYLAVASVMTTNVCLLTGERGRVTLQQQAR